MTETLANPANPAAPSDSVPSEAVLLVWRVYRLREQPKYIALVAAGYAMAFLLWRIVFPHPLALVLPVFGLTGALSEYLFPITYKLTTRGAYRNNGLTRLFIAWPHVRRATYGADGVHLSPFGKPSRLDNFRGVRLAFVGNEAEVLQTVRGQWRRDVVDNVPDKEVIL